MGSEQTTKNKFDTIYLMPRLSTKKVEKNLQNTI